MQMELFEGWWKISLCRETMRGGGGGSNSIYNISLLAFAPPFHRVRRP